MEDKDKQDNSVCGINTPTNEMQSEPANKAPKLEISKEKSKIETAKTSQTPTDTISENVPETQKSNNDELPEEFFDAEMAIPRESQEQKENVTSKETDVDDVFMELDDPDEITNSKQNEENDESVIELDQTEYHERVKETHDDVEMREITDFAETSEIKENADGIIALDKTDDVLHGATNETHNKNNNADIEVKSNDGEEDLTEDQLNESEITENTSHIVISDVSTEEPDTETSKMVDISMDLEKVTAEPEDENSNNFKGDEENAIFDKVQDGQSEKDIVDRGSDNLDQAEEEENLSLAPLKDNEEVALPSALESEEKETEKEKEDEIEAEANELEISRKDAHSQQSQNDEPEAEKEIGSLPTESETSFSEDFCLPNTTKNENKSHINESPDLFASEKTVSIATESEASFDGDFCLLNTTKKDNKSNINESFDLFASESGDTNLPSSQIATQKSVDDFLETENATTKETSLLESQQNIKEPEKEEGENELEKLQKTSQETDETKVPLESDCEIKETVDLVGEENEEVNIETEIIKDNVSVEETNLTEVGDKIEGDQLDKEKDNGTVSSKDQENKKESKEDEKNELSEVIVQDDEKSAAPRFEKENESGINEMKETSKIEDEASCTARNDQLQTEDKSYLTSSNNESELNELVQETNSTKKVDEKMDKQMKADAPDTNEEECKKTNLNESAKEIFVFQQKIDSEKLQGEKIKKKHDEVSVIEIDDDDEAPSAVDNAKATKIDKPSESKDSNTQHKNQEQCINVDCQQGPQEFFRATLAAMQYYKIEKKVNKKQFVCENCYEQAMNKYDEYVDVLRNKIPLYSHKDLEEIPDAVEIIESSDEEDDDERARTKADTGDFQASTLDFIEQELENTMKSVFDMVEIQKQLTWCKTLQGERLKRIDKQNEEHEIELNRIQQEVDNMQTAIYQYPKVTIRALQPLDLNSNNDMDWCSNDESPTKLITNLPPIGEIVRHPIVINGMYYAVKNKPIASWVPCTVLELTDNKFVPLYKIKYLYSQHQMVKHVSAKNVAYYNAPEVRLPIGSRVIAYFDVNQLQRGREKVNSVHSAFYPGIIAEPMRVNNNYRYLIFYDDGYTQYVKHEHVRLVCNVSDNVWEDIHPNSREFIKKYLMQYAINRPMVQTQKGQTMQTESDGKWMYARVVDIDCSLVQMQFDGPKNHTEWIYRGSARLGPVFKEFQKNRDSGTFSRLTRRTEPFIRYTIDDETTMQQQREELQNMKVQLQQQEQQIQQHQIQRPPTAKKSTALPQQQQLQQPQQHQQHLTSRPPPVRHLNNSTIYLEDDTVPKGKTIFYMTKRDLPPTKYSKHKCNRSCRSKVTHSLAIFNPLSKPLITGWERMLMRQKSKIVVVYRGPCGKIMRNIKEVHTYLRATDCIWNVEHFDFSPEINCLAEFVIESAKLRKADISMGKEKMPIPLINCYDNTLPPECEYSAQRIPTEGVNLNLDEEFLVGCDCEDDCSDKSKCSCWKLTLAGAKYGNPNTPIDEVGYQYKRLYEHVPTGIYECNSRCKCKSSCLNRVVQKQLQLKLEVFKTSNRGWGLRCVNDVPRGSFVCIYAGHLLTEAKANEGGLDAGDEYFAELDYIEVAEQIKEGYENEVESVDLAEDEEEIYVPEGDDDDEFRPSKSFVKRNRNKARSIRQIDDDSLERQVINFNPNADMNENSMRESSMRSLFGKDEACYIMDAKITGNLGRYFNHSCAPNLFVQNVFVDTHDLRFPWVAFFASSNIRSGTELTWNYNYEVGVVPGKVLYCQCGASNCRVRLL